VGKDWNHPSIQLIEEFRIASYSFISHPVIAEGGKIAIFASQIKMENDMLKGILAITGQPGLYKVISEGKNNVVIESLLTGKKSTAYADAKMSTLEDIAIYTLQEDIPLKKVFRKIHEKENGGQAISVKSTPEELKNYFSEVLPEYDKDRVYGSDVKKVISWYNLLNEKGLLIFEDEKSDEESSVDELSASEEVTE
jgi:hypothetical protein